MHISEFCSTGRNERRRFCRAPWNAGGFTIATDSIIIAAVPEIKVYPSGESVKAPDALGLIYECEKVSFEPANLDLKPGGPTCHECHGFGRINVEMCPDCDGEGEVEFSTQRHVYTFECKECGGNGEYIWPNSSGEFSCAECHGFGYINGNLKINDREFAFHYLMKISGLPGLQIGFKEPGGSKLYFKTDGGLQGILMGLYREGEWEKRHAKKAI